MTFNADLYTQLLSEKLGTTNYETQVITTITSVVDGKYTVTEIRAFEKELNEKDPQYNYKVKRELCTYEIQTNKNIPVCWNITFEVTPKNEETTNYKTIESVVVN